MPTREHFQIDAWLECLAIGSLLIVIDVVSGSTVIAQSTPASSAQSGPQSGLIASSINSNPSELPQMGVWIKPPYDTFFTASFPGIPDLVVDAFVYEMANYQGVDRLDLIDVSVPGLEKQDTLRLCYRVHDYPGIVLVTTFTASPGAVETVAGFEMDPSHAGDPNAVPVDRGAEEGLLNKIRPTTLCWSFDRGSAFSPNGKHSPESKAPENYPEWIRRCFIFTNEGRTFLDKTSRRKTNEPWIPDDSPQQTQPFCWSQHYVGVGQDPLQGFPANTSLTRYVVPIMGAVSRDDRHLIALAADDALYSAQAWNTCLHQFPKWTPIDGPLLQRHWRMKLYAMDNDPDAMLARYHNDFPGSASARQ